MQKIIVPDDEEGLVYMTSDGKPIMQIAYRDDASILTLFSKNENSKILMICHEDWSALSVRNGQKNIELSIDSSHNGISITNEDGNITNDIRTDEDGGQITLSDNTGNPLLDMGISSDADGSLIFIRNKDGESVVSLTCYKDGGYIQVTDKNKDIIWSSPNE
jgi:hypothetical protein